MSADVAADLCRYLNELAALDRRAMYRQVRTLSPCNADVWYRLTEHHVVRSDVGSMLGMLGLLNGWLAESGVRLMANFDHDEDIVTGFDLELVANDAPLQEEAHSEALSLVCAHCGPESAGPAADAPRTCATCYGDLVLTDPAGAEVLRRWYNEPDPAAE